MKPSRVFASLFFACASFTLLSAQVVLTNNIRVYSENKSFYANIAKSANNITELGVFRVSSGNEEWTSWMEWGKDYTGYLSNDGKVFIAVNSVYSEYHNLVTVFYPSKQQSYTVKSIPIGREFLKLLNGRYLWIDPDLNYLGFKYDGGGSPIAFEIELNDKRVVGLKIE